MRVGRESRVRRHRHRRHRVFATTAPTRSDDRRSTIGHFFVALREAVGRGETRGRDDRSRRVNGNDARDIVCACKCIITNRRRRRNSRRRRRRHVCGKSNVFSSKANGHHRDVDVFAFVVFARDDDVEVSTLGGNFHLRHGLHQLAEFLVQTLLVFGENIVINQTRADGHGVRDQALGLEVVQDLLNREIALQDPSVPHAPRQVFEFVLLGRDGLRHGEQREREVGERVAIRLNLRAFEHLVQFEAHQTRRHRRRRRDGWNNSPRDKLCFEFIDLTDVIVARTHVGKTSDGVHVKVCVVVLLKLDDVESVISSQARSLRFELGQHVLDHSLVVDTFGNARSGGVRLGVGLDLDALLRFERRDGHLVDELHERGVVVDSRRRSRDPRELRFEVRHGADERHVRSVRGGKYDWSRETLRCAPER